MVRNISWVSLVLVPNHLHCIAQSLPKIDSQELEDFLPNAAGQSLGFHEIGHPAVNILKNNPPKAN